MVRKLSVTLLLAIIVGALTIFPALRASGLPSIWFQTTRLTDNAFEDYEPRISGDKAVWSANGGPHGTSEIYFWDGSSVIRLTNNSDSDYSPRISGDKVVWQGAGGAGGTGEIYLWDGSGVTNLSSNGFQDYDPQISGDKVVWAGTSGPGGTSEIYLWDGSSVTRLTENAFWDVNPQISGDKVVWAGTSGPTGTSEIYLWDGSSEIRLTDNAFYDWWPQISGDKVVWHGSVADGSWEIYLWDGANVTNLSGNELDDQYPQISGGKVVWQGSGGPNGSLEIYLWDGSRVVRLTDNDFDDYEPQISGDKVVWRGESGPEGTTEIYLWDGSSVVRLTDNDFDDEEPQISGDNIVWVGRADSEGVGEIYLARLDSQAPINPTVAGSNPAKNTWTNAKTAQVNFSGATDNLSGVDGYSVSWTNSSSTIPNKIKDLGAAASSATSPTLSDGNWWFHLRTVDKAGNWSSPLHYGPFKVDTARPTATLSAPAISTTASKTLSFKVSWSGNDGADPKSGIAAYDVEYKVGPKGTWQTWKTNTTAKSADFKLAKAGKTYYFRALAKDKAGNESAWSTVKKTIVPYDNNSLIASRSGFGSTAKSLSSGFYLGTTRYSTKRGHKITYKFTGKSVALIGPKASSRAKAKVYINGNYVKTIDAYSSTLKHRQVLFSKTWSKSGTRTITIENLGTAGRTRFDVDGLGVGR
jgi:beta propeller repeat protein